MSINEALEREAFEAAAKAEKVWDGWLRRMPGGAYGVEYIELAWKLWLRARSQAPAPAWVAVGERLPTPLEMVLFNISYEGVTRGYYVVESKDDETGEVYNPAHFTEINLVGGTEFYLHEVTHWQPLPPPPQAEEKV